MASLRDRFMNQYGVVKSLRWNTFWWTLSAYFPAVSNRLLCLYKVTPVVSLPQNYSFKPSNLDNCLTLTICLGVSWKRGFCLLLFVWFFFVFVHALSFMVLSRTQRLWHCAGNNLVRYHGVREKKKKNKFDILRLHLKCIMELKVLNCIT